MPKTPKLTERKSEPVSKDDIGNPQDFRHILHVRSSSISHNMQRLHVFDNVEEGERMTSTDQTQRSSKSNADLCRLLVRPDCPVRGSQYHKDLRRIKKRARRASSVDKVTKEKVTTRDGKNKRKSNSVFYDLGGSRFYDLEGSRSSDLDAGERRSRLSRNMAGMVDKLMHALKKDSSYTCPNQNDDNSLLCRNSCDVSPELPPKLVSLYKNFPGGLSQIPPKEPHLLVRNQECPVSSIQDEDMDVKPVPKKRIESAKAEEEQKGPAIRIYRI